MTFDPKSLLGPPALTVDALAAELKRLSAIGMGGTLVKLPDGREIEALRLQASGEVPAHFVIKPK
jgi:hypothetical protein